MELYIIEDYKAIFPHLKGSALTDALAAECLDAYGTREAKILRTEKGKPYIKEDGSGENVYFSVSHSGNYFLCLVADTPVGVDVQEERNAKMHKISARYFTEKEKQYLTEKGEDGFFVLWCRKEAYSKYTGNGMEDILKGTSVLEREDVVFFDFQLEKGMYGSCCIKK